MTIIKTSLKAFIRAASLALLILYKTKDDVLSYVTQQPMWQKHTGASSKQDPRALCVIQCCSPLSRWAGVMGHCCQKGKVSSTSPSSPLPSPLIPGKWCSPSPVTALVLSGHSFNLLSHQKLPEECLTWHKISTGSIYFPAACLSVTEDTQAMCSETTSSDHSQSI